MFALLITVLFIIVVCGGFSLIFHYAPFPEPFKGLGRWLCIVVAILWLLYAVAEGWRFRLPR